MSGQELLKLAREAKPDVRYAMNAEGNGIGAWNDALGRYQLVAGTLLTGEWVALPVEILVNGCPIKNDWQED